MDSLRLPDDWNLHHLYWQRRDYKTGFEKRFRNHDGLVVPTQVVNHKLLHARLAAPPKPSRQMMGDCMDILEIASPAEKMDRLWGACAVAGYFRELAEEASSPELAKNAARLEQHMSTQIGFLSIKLAVIGAEV